MHMWQHGLRHDLARKLSHASAAAGQKCAKRTAAFPGHAAGRLLRKAGGQAACSSLPNGPARRPQLLGAVSHACCVRCQWVAQMAKFSSFGWPSRAQPATKQLRQGPEQRIPAKKQAPACASWGQDLSTKTCWTWSGVGTQLLHPDSGLLAKDLSVAG